MMQTQKQNSRVIEKGKDGNVQPDEQQGSGLRPEGLSIIDEERYEKGSMMAYLNGLDTKTSLARSIETYNSCY